MCFNGFVHFLFANSMGSDLGHDQEDSLQFFAKGDWSRGEKELLRVILSHRYGSILLCVILELMFYHYAVFRVYE